MRFNPLAKKESLKRDYEILSQSLKSEVLLLTRMRHPHIARICDPLIEQNSIIAFTSEILHATLSHFLTNTSQIPSSTMNLAYYFEGKELNELSIQLGILQISKALIFLQLNLVVLGCIEPSSIFIDTKGDWKLSGFFSAALLNNGEEGICNSFLPSYCTPALGFFPPEVICDRKCYQKSDVWAFASLIFAVFNAGQPVVSCNNPTDFKSEVERLSVASLRNVPPLLQPILKIMLKCDYSARCDLETLTDCQYFQTGALQSMIFIESFIEKSLMEKVKFLKDFVKTLPLLSFKLVVSKILPVLIDDLKEESLVIFLLPSMLWFICQVTQGSVKGAQWKIFQN